MTDPTTDPDTRTPERLDDQELEQAAGGSDRNDALGQIGNDFGAVADDVGDVYNAVKNEFTQ